MKGKAMPKNDDVKIVETTEVKQSKKFFNYRNRPPQVVLCSQKPSKVQESPLDARSPQELMDKYGMYRDKSALKDVTPFYADLSSFNGFEDSLNHLRDIEEKFMSLDSEVRARFNHNPVEFCNYLQSKDFDIKRVMTDEQFEVYTRDLEDAKRQRDLDAYMKSKEYSEMLKEQETRRAYEQAKYEEWKKNFVTK